MRKKIFIVFILVLAGTIMATLAIINTTPKLVISAVRNTVFKIEVDNSKESYEVGDIVIKTNLTYESKYSNNKFDIYQPQKN